MSIYNEDVAKVVLENAPRNAKYTSRHVQKDILHVLAKRVQNAIREEIDNSKFCIIIDEARDESKRKQMAIIFEICYKKWFHTRTFI
jgi:AAA+ ATPase superfamily predicted ATPase